MEYERPLFMNDNSESDYGKEAMLDYQLSWLLRLSACRDLENKKLEKISRKVMLKFLGYNNEEKVEIKDVKVWKQWNHIDLIAEVVVLIGDIEEKYVVVIEDKAYTKLHGDQLQNYKNVVENYYEPNWHRRYYVVTFYNKDDNYKDWIGLSQQCEVEDWSLLSFYDVIENYDEPTGSDLFDEFWIKTWY